MVPLPDMVFLGYRVKRPWNPGPAWEPIRLVCCVGESLCEPPEGWIERWDFNRGFCYPTPEDAWRTVGGDPAPYRLFAYDLLPLELWSGEPPEARTVEEILDPTLPKLPPRGTRPTGMALLGYDVAERRYGELGFPYSPLVNNGFSADFPTNPFGLLQELDLATEACGAINARMPEHAPHWVFRVFGLDVVEK